MFSDEMNERTVVLGIYTHSTGRNFKGKSPQKIGKGLFEYGKCPKIRVNTHSRRNRGSF